jgi:hypothetical protein
MGTKHDGQGGSKRGRRWVESVGEEKKRVVGKPKWNGEGLAQ